MAQGILIKSGDAAHASKAISHRIKGNWKQITGKAKEQWGNLTDDDLEVIAGHRGQLAGKIRERYGVAKVLCGRVLSMTY